MNENYKKPCLIAFRIRDQKKNKVVLNNFAPLPEGE